MQDRFKFRGLKDGKWYYGAYLKYLPYTPYCCSEPPEKDYKHLIIREGFSDWGLPRDITCVEVEEDTVGQCIGLKDKNGKLIYEGDIVKTYPSSYFDKDNDVFYVKYTLSGFYIARPYKNMEGDWECDDTIGCYVEKLYEIIGNMYENPELLEREI